MAERMTENSRNSRIRSFPVTEIDRAPYGGGRFRRGSVKGVRRGFSINIASGVCMNTVNNTPKPSRPRSLHCQGSFIWSCTTWIAPPKAKRAWWIPVDVRGD
jgi:hypothetical protein